MDSRDRLPLIHEQPSSQKQSHQEREKNQQNQTKKTLKVPSRRLESRIEKRKVARLIGGPVVRQSACPLRLFLFLIQGSKRVV